ncbi:MAG: hypothetical protein JST68_29050 [Bacteroidetes bacterium]|nr:hypothetical protein [Bacteroidota bacterium]
MNTRPLYLIALLLLGLSGCQLISNPLPHLWFYTYATGSDGDSLLTPASFLELRGDGSYTRDFGQFEYGGWTRKDKQILLTNQQHKTNTLTIKGLSSKEMQLVMPDGKEGSFESLPLPSATAAEDPFSSKNNLWRIPPDHKETEAGIRQRLFNHCQFWETYFTWALDKQLETIDVRSTPTSIKIYGNGFGVKPFDELPARWKGCFFDEEDCRKANEMIEDIFRHKSIAWAHTDNKFKLFISAFQQLKRYLR